MHIEAAQRLLDRENNLTPQSEQELFSAATDNGFKAAAKALREEVALWNGNRFEQAVRRAFEDQGYTVKIHRHYDGRGGDADIVVSPPVSRYGLFMPGEIAVQVKWKQDKDRDDVEAVWQIVNWPYGSNAVLKCVISSANSFTQAAQALATDNDVVLIGGLQTMCFLLDISDRYREDWD